MLSTLSPCLNALNLPHSPFSSSLGVRIAVDSLFGDLRKFLFQLMLLGDKLLVLRVTRNGSLHGPLSVISQRRHMLHLRQELLGLVRLRGQMLHKGCALVRGGLGVDFFPQLGLLSSFSL